ncbi:MAG: hypothetical protein AB4042_09180 [Leptolyngbyaceae cyanobacterium]
MFQECQGAIGLGGEEGDRISSQQQELWEREDDRFTMKWNGRGRSHFSTEARCEEEEEAIALV